MVGVFGGDTVADYYESVGAGKIPGSSGLTVAGQISTSSATFVDLSDVGGVQVLPTSPESLEVVSVLNDTNGGSGAWSVLITGLDGNYEPLTEIVTLSAGTVPLISQFLRTFSMRVLFAGGFSGTNPYNNNENDITLRVAGGGAQRLIARKGSGVSFSGLYTVPAGNTLGTVGLVFFGARNDDIDIRPLVTPNIANAASVSGSPFKISDSSPYIPQIIPFPTPEKTDIRVQCRKLSGGGDVTVSGIINFELKQTL